MFADRACTSPNLCATALDQCVLGLLLITVCNLVQSYAPCADSTLTGPSASGQSELKRLALNGRISEDPRCPPRFC